MSELSGVLTDLGAQLIEEAYQAGRVITLTEMGLGDGGGSDVNVSPDVTSLVGEFHRQPLDSGVAEDAALGGTINYVPEDEDRGKWVRELGMYDDAGNLIVYGATPLAQIPINPNLGVQFIISAAVPIEYVDSVVVVVNPEGSATREDLEEHERSRRHPAAEEGLQGMMPLATQDMVAEGDDHTSALTPKTAAAHYFPLASYKPRTDSLNNQQGEIAIVSGKDMNTCVAGEFGLYEKATCANAPASAGEMFYCETKSIYGSSALIQLAYPNAGAGVLAWRNFGQSSGAWDAVWREAYDTGHQPPHPGSMPEPINLDGADLNTIISPGTYYVSDNSLATGRNYPESGKSGSLIVTKGGGIQQRFHVYYTNHVYIRSTPNYTGDGPWLPWEIQYNSGNPPSWDDVQGKPITPVGSVLFFTDGRINPATYNLGTTWARIAVNHNIRGAGDGESGGGTGGSDVVALTVNELPPHIHGTEAHNHAGESHTHNMFLRNGDLETTPTSGSRISSTRNSASGGSGSTNTYWDYLIATGSGSEEVGITSPAAGNTGWASPNTLSAGSGAAFSVLNAFFKLHIWQRIS